MGDRILSARRWAWLLSVLALLSCMVAQAAPVKDLRKIVLGKYHGCAVTIAGALRCFGNDGDGQLGADHKSFSTRALMVLPSGVTDVALSDEHTCAVVNGALYCWGSNKYGQLGTGAPGEDVTRPAKAAAVSGTVTSVAAGWGTTCAILAPKGMLQCWGRNDLGQVGNGSNDEKVPQPFTVFESGVTAVAVGGQSTCAVVDSGLQCWGFMLFQDKNFETLLRPTSIIPAGQGVTAVANALHTCVVVKEALQCWGRNFNGQVGVPDGSRTAPLVPTTVIPSGVTALALNDENTCAVVKGGLMCWGSNSEALGPEAKRSDVPMPLAVPGVPAASIRDLTIGMKQLCVLTYTAAQRDSTLLQCTYRFPYPEDVEATGESPEDWQGFGTEWVGFAEPLPVLPRVARYGLWQGTIGTQEVMVLLVPELCGARYYYKKHLFGIPLEEKERRQGTRWTEAPYSEHPSVWTFSTSSEDGQSLGGEWSSEDGKRRAPIRLKLVGVLPSKPGDNGRPDYDCYAQNKAFDAPRVAQALQKRKVSAADTMIFKGSDGDHPYRPVTVFRQQITGFTTPDIDRHPQLRKAMEAWETESVEEYFDCAFGLAPNYSDSDVDYRRELSPRFWNSQLLVLEETYSNFCGGAHPNGGTSGYRVWDLAADREVEASTLIKGIEDQTHVTSAALLDLLKKHYRRGDEKGEDSCADALDGEDFYMMHPQASGMVFMPSLPHVIQACAEEIEVPWAEMQPFLSTEGKKIVRRLGGGLRE